MVYPEGRRYPEGTLGAFKPFMFVLSQRLGVPILPVTIAGTADLAPADGSNWMRAGARVTVTFHPLVQPEAGEEATAYAERVRSIMASA